MAAGPEGMIRAIDVSDACRRLDRVVKHFTEYTLPSVAAGAWRRYAIPFFFAYALMAVTYGYLFTTIVFSNHTLPNTWIYKYPSIKTTIEGRWFADIIIQFTGGSGVPSLQMAVAAAIQIINGFLFASFLRVKNIFHFFLAGAFIALHPVFLDYFSFSADHISFALGDTGALLGIMALARISNRPLGIAIAILCFVLTLATYQPKASLIAVLLLVWTIEFVATEQNSSGSSSWGRLLSERLVPAVFAFIASLLLYYLTAKVTVVLFTEDRAHINGPYEVWQQALAAYPDVWRHFFGKVDYLTLAFRFLPATMIVLGTASILGRTYSLRRPLIPAAVGLIALFPIALQVVYIINDRTWRDSGRILGSEAYCLLYFLMNGWRVEKLRLPTTIIIVLAIWQFVIVGSQQVNEAEMKTIFDFSKINRIISRIEEVTPDLYEKKMPLVIFGRLPLGTGQPEFRKTKNSVYQAQMLEESFAVYRQVVIANFFLGRELLTSPTKPEFESALASIKSRPSWPAPESVYVDNGVIVVILDKNRPDINHTWTRAR